MNGFEGNPEEIVAKGTRIVSIGGKCMDEKRIIYKGAERLATAWVGADSSQFLSSLNSYEKDFENFANVIDRIGNILTEHGNTLINTRDEISRIAQGL